MPKVSKIFLLDSVEFGISGDLASLSVIIKLSSN